MAVLLKAIATCDHFGCKASVEIELNITTDDRKIPCLELEYSPKNDGWEISLQKESSSWNRDLSCACPDHNPFKR